MPPWLAAGFSALLVVRVMTFDATLLPITVGNGLIGVWLLITAALLLAASFVPSALGWLGIAGGAGLALASMGFPVLGREHPVIAVAGLGRETQLTGRIVEFVDERSATMSLQGGPIGEALVEYAVEPIDDGRSVVAYRAQGQLIRPLRFLEPIMPEIGRAEARRNLVGLQRRIDGGIPAGAAVTRGMPTSASDKGGHP